MTQQLRNLTLLACCALWGCGGESVHKQSQQSESVPSASETTKRFVKVGSVAWGATMTSLRDLKPGDSITAADTSKFRSACFKESETGYQFCFLDGRWAPLLKARGYSLINITQEHRTLELKIRKMTSAERDIFEEDFTDRRPDAMAIDAIVPDPPMREIRIN